jgi:hypothetical protein
MIVLSLPHFSRGGWGFNISVVGGVILIVAHNEVFFYTQCMYFKTRETASNWINSLIIAEKIGDKHDDETR